MEGKVSMFAMEVSPFSFPIRKKVEKGLKIQNYPAYYQLNTMDPPDTLQRHYIGQPL